jgi:uncharacterized protein (TIGR02246 family)
LEAIVSNFGQKIRELGDRYAKAWCSHLPEEVSAFFSSDGQIQINKGEALKGREAIAQMAESFYAAFPDLIVHCDDVRMAGKHVLFLWTLQGHHAQTKNFVKVGGWEEWEIDDDLKVKSSLGWYDAVDYQRQIGGNPATS